MEPILFVLMLVMIAGSVVVYVASGMEQHGQAWAHQVCDLYNVCDHAMFVFAATAMVTVLYLISCSART
jgi:uncharacterized membrane protein YwaF